ncbi:hypothetical protein, partial [Moorena sp. SIO4G3]|uniref:hypothetical protein n=1 Tax=Moorena sp. SIO4G3 TaxID=2607821 RepID=UPI001429CBA5
EANEGARDLHHPPLHNELRLWDGRVQERLGRLDAAQEAYERVLEAALEIDQFELASRAAEQLVLIIGDI